LEPTVPPGRAAVVYARKIVADIDWIDMQPPPEVPEVTATPVTLVSSAKKGAFGTKILRAFADEVMELEASP
jgi:hypothetical protein